MPPIVAVKRRVGYVPESKRTKGKATAKDLRVGKKAGEAVKGGRTIRITNTRADAVAIGVSTTFTTS